MDKILYRKISSNDNLVLVVQALIDKQAELVEFVNGLSMIADNSNLFSDRSREKYTDEEIAEIQEQARRQGP